MNCIRSKIGDVYFNLAAEEYFIRNKTEDYIMLWQSEPAVVVGKHQNVIAEINSQYVENNGIKVARRLSGGGAVYHDKGNLNFTFIMNGEKNKMVDFMKFVQPIINFIKMKGIPAVAGKRNDILVDGFKISGNAEHVFKTRILHHGTLLFNTDLEAVRQSLSADTNKFTDRAIQSNRSNIINLADSLKDPIDIETFSMELLQYLTNYFQDCADYEMNETERSEILTLRNEKYASWDWVYGYSPGFEINTSLILENKNIEIHLKIEKGIIITAELPGSSVPEEVKFAIENLINKRFDFTGIRSSLHGITKDNKLITEMLKSLF
jgi:lipoate---protein ligase